MTAQEIARVMDISAVRADSTLEEIREAAQLAKQYGCIGVFALPAHTQYLIDLLSGSPVFAGGAVGFPGGGETTASKAATADELVGMGCREIDMVNNLAWLKAGKKGPYMRDVGAVVEAAGGRPVKVILECHWLTEHEIVLEDAAWIADTGRFSQALAAAEFSEVEPFPCGRVIVGRGSIIDAVQIKIAPRSQK